jgi:perosamine synthetase
MIPLSTPNLAGNEWQYIKECLDTNWVSSVGTYVDKFEQLFAEYTGSKYAISTCNGTSALHISLLLASVQANDYVILPNITFIASANSIQYCNASPLLVDIFADTWQIDTVLLEKFLSEKTYLKENQCFLEEDNRCIRAIMPVHVLGNMSEMQKITELAQKFNLKIIEDATEALGSFQNGKHAGNFGNLGCFSFNGNKIMTTGGGGMIVTNDETLAKHAKHLTTQAKSDSFEYIHDEVGYNYRMVNILAAMGVAQLEQMPVFLKRKQEIFKFYREKFKKLPIQFQETTPHTQSNAWLFTICAERQKELIQHLTNQKIQVRPFWLPMNRLKMYENNVYVSENDVAFKIYEKSVSLPCSTGITEKELEKVALSVADFYWE